MGNDGPPDAATNEPSAIANGSITGGCRGYAHFEKRISIENARVFMLDSRSLVFY